MAIGSFLLQHLWGIHHADNGLVQYLFKLCPGRHGDVSIRYRVRLAARIVSQARQEKLLEDRDDRLMVINAGAAGLSATLTAADLGVNVYLRSRDTAVGAPLRNCMTRVVDPCIYFWPRGDHWLDSYVAASKEEPLAWEHDTAHAVAERWREQYEIVRSHHQRDRRIVTALGDDEIPNLYAKENLSMLEATRVRDWTPLLDRIDPGREYRVILFTGIPPEDCSIRKTYTGPAFWENDELQHWCDGETQHHALVSGAGDGALQDALRLACGGRSARTIYECLFGRIEKSAPSQSGPYPDPPALPPDFKAEEVARRLSRLTTTYRDLSVGGQQLDEALAPLPLIVDISAAGSSLLEENYRRGLASSPVKPDFTTEADLLRFSDDSLFFWMEMLPPMDESDEHQLREFVHGRYTTIVNVIERRTEEWQKLCWNIEKNKLLSRALREKGRRVALACRQPYFAACYPLNQFLTLLIDRYIDRKLENSRKMLSLGVAVREVSPEGGDHTKCVTAENCFNKNHQAVFRVTSNSHDGGQMEKLGEMAFDAVVIRHGLQKV